MTVDQQMMYLEGGEDAEGKIKTLPTMGEARAFIGQLNALAEK